MAAREYSIAFTLPPLAKGDVFIAWPLHMTLVPWFSTREGVRAEEIATILAEEVAKHRPLAVQALKRAQFGPRKNFSVTELENTHELQDLHNSLVGLIESHGWHIAAQWYTKDSFRPHITDRAHDKLVVGTSLMITELCLAVASVADPRTRQKNVIDVFALGGVHG